jgi:hypothetical protein
VDALGADRSWGVSELGQNPHLRRAYLLSQYLTPLICRRPRLEVLEVFESVLYQDCQLLGGNAAVDSLLEGIDNMVAVLDDWISSVSVSYSTDGAAAPSRREIADNARSLVHKIRQWRTKLDQYSPESSAIDRLRKIESEIQSLSW